MLSFSLLPHHLLKQKKEQGVVEIGGKTVFEEPHKRGNVSNARMPLTVKLDRIISSPTII